MFNAIYVGQDGSVHTFSGSLSEVLIWKGVVNRVSDLDYLEDFPPEKISRLEEIEKTSPVPRK